MKLPNSDEKDEALQTPSITNSMRQINTWTDYNQTVKSQEERILKAQEKWLSHTKYPNKSNSWLLIRNQEDQNAVGLTLLLLSVTKSSPTFWDPVDCSTWGFPVLHHLPEFAQTHVRWVSDIIQSSHPLLPPSPPVLNLSQHEGLLQWVLSLHQVAKVWELQIQHQSFQWIFRVDFL